MKKVVCNQCGASYDDEESVELTEKWIADGFAPCPNISCPGQLELKEIDIEQVKTEVS